MVYSGLLIAATRFGLPYSLVALYTFIILWLVLEFSFDYIGFLDPSIKTAGLIDVYLSWRAGLLSPLPTYDIGDVIVFTAIALYEV